MSTHKAFSYIRFSTPEQAKGDSLRRQTEAAADWCQRNGITLDTETTFRDLGKSAFLGDHRSNPERHRLAVFLKMVQDGKIPRGSFLILENLDRLSREHIQPALLLVLNLLQAGIRVVQLKPSELIFDDKSGTLEIMMGVMELARGHGESAIKSERVGKAWREKKRQARENGAIVTKRLPAWIEVRDGKLKLIEESARAVRRIFALCNQGYGVASILRQLKADGIKPIGTASTWGKSYVHRILVNRAVIGEYQPRKGEQPDGPPILDYFPAVVSTDDFTKARAALSRRTDFRGRISAKVPALFSGLLTDASTGSRIWIKKNSRGKHVLTSAAAVECQVDGPVPTFAYAAFEGAVLSLLKEIKPADVLGTVESEGESVAIATELANLDAQLAKIEAELADGDVSTLARAARALEEKRLKVAAQLDAARQREASPLHGAWDETQTLLDAAKKEADRLRLRDLLRRIVDDVRVLIVPRGQSHRLAAVQIFFVGGARRDYLIYHRVACNGRKGECKAASFDLAAGDKRRAGKVDLRIAQHVETVTTALEEIPLEELAEIGDPVELKSASM